MVDVRCPRCGSLIGRAEGRAQFRCHKARCFAIVNVDTSLGAMEMIRYGAGANVRNTHEKFGITEIQNKYEEGYFRISR